MRTKIIAIAACDLQGAIGKNGKLLFRLREDMLHFAQTTKGHAVLMGRKTFDEIGKPLADRQNFILSASLKYIEGAKVFGSIPSVLDYCESQHIDKLFLIGGGTIYEQTVNMWSELHLTVLSKIYDYADVFLPSWFSEHWSIKSQRSFIGDDGYGNRHKSDIYHYVKY